MHIKNTSVFCIALFLGFYGKAQFCTNDNRFTEVDFFTQDQIAADTGIVYANADGQNLAMDIFYPNDDVETLDDRPFIMLFHGGSFISGFRQMLTSTCIEFAKKGFVAATVSYRLSDELDIPAQYKAAQDGHAAMRYIVQNASTYKINTDWLFVGGGSAGAINSFAMVFIDQIEWQNRDQMNDLMAEYGLLYSNGNTLTNTYDLKGVFNNWGSIYVIAYDTEEAVPTISFHGGQDNTVDIDLNTTTLTGGGNVVHARLTQDNVCSDLTVDSLGGHGIYVSPQGNVFRVGKASCFFKSIFCNTCNSNSTFDSIPAKCSTIPVGFSELENVKEEIEIFPNPTSDLFRLNTNLNFALIEIRNARGQVIKSMSINSTTETIDMSAFPSGLYLIRMQSLNGDTQAVKRLMKE